MIYQILLPLCFFLPLVHDVNSIRQLIHTLITNQISHHTNARVIGSIYHCGNETWRRGISTKTKKSCETWSNVACRECLSIIDVNYKYNLECNEKRRKYVPKRLTTERRIMICGLLQPLLRLFRSVHLETMFA